MWLVRSFFLSGSLQAAARVLDIAELGSVLAVRVGCMLSMYKALLRVLAISLESILLSVSRCFFLLLLTSGLCIDTLGLSSFRDQAVLLQELRVLQGEGVS